MDSSVQIVATGARTPLGMQAVASAAAVRAAINAVAEHPFMVDHLGDPVMGGFDPFLDPNLIGADRFLALADSPLREVCEPLQKRQISDFRLPVFLGLPEFRPGFSEQDAEAIRLGFTLIQDPPVEISEVNVFPSGHTAGLMAIAEATEKIQLGVIDACIVGGVDSYFQPETLEWLEHHRQLAVADTRSSFYPGEGASFCLLFSDRMRKRLGMNSLGQVRSVSLSNETKLIKTADTCLGEGLTETVRSAVSSLTIPAETISDIFCDINGERYRGEEWGFVCLRLSEYFDDASTYCSPAASWGDMGAASGPLFIMLACQAALKGYAKGPRAMLWASSEAGQRGAAVLEFRNTLRRGVGDHG